MIGALIALPLIAWGSVGYALKQARTLLLKTDETGQELLEPLLVSPLRRLVRADPLKPVPSPGAPRRRY